MALAFPDIDPIAFRLGPLEVHWYGIAYLVGIVLGWRYILWLVRRDSPKFIRSKDVDDFVFWATVSIIAGGRLGYVLFYNPWHYLFHPWEAFMPWMRGMSFHGGFLGVVLTGIVFCIKRRLPILRFWDLLAAAAPIGLFFGRLANFINGELYGRPTNVAWGIIFPEAGPWPRHPSQLYEMFLEGALMFGLLVTLETTTTLRQRRPGFYAAVFLIGYAMSRSIAELYRQPDAHIGFLFGGATMGQLLSTPLFIGGIFLLWNVLQQKQKDCKK